MKLSTIFAIVAVAVVSNLVMVDAGPALRRRAVTQTKEQYIAELNAASGANRSNSKAIDAAEAAIRNAGTPAAAQKEMLKLVKHLEVKGALPALLNALFGEN
ncbi:hypothetical protein BDF22DRAFT_740447 [Syncephalis plumigaleata]|nr:hypothetical protein BDF22DRAFT_740447 [Syncephalis plumigaleata]